MEAYEYAAAKSEVEAFFWKDLADNYLEMAKQRLYSPEHALHAGAVFALSTVLETTLKLFAPFLPFVTEAIYRELFSQSSSTGPGSIHTSRWPQVKERFESEAAEQFGDLLVEIATSVRRYKSEQNLSLGTQLHRLQLAAGDSFILSQLQDAGADLTSVTRAQMVEFSPDPAPDKTNLGLSGGRVWLWIDPAPIEP
jgi:valyl-tRNA synthetase